MLFLDEIHRMSRPAEEMLYMAMEDFRVDVIVGKGPGATAIPLELPPFTLVGATTRAGLLPPPAARPVRLHRRTWSSTSPPSWSGSSTARRACSTWRSTPTGAAEIAGRSRGTPRIANRLLRRVRDYAQVKADGVDHPRDRRARPWRSTRSTTAVSTGSTGPCSRRCSSCSAAARSGLSTLAVAVGEERETVEEVAEPFLVREGLLARTPRGRVATPAAWAHLGLTPRRRPAPGAQADNRGLFGA